MHVVPGLDEFLALCYKIHKCVCYLTLATTQEIFLAGIIGIKTLVGPHIQVQ